METDDGRRLLDFASGVAVNSLGHAHPALVKVLTEQAGKIWHVSNLYRIPEQEALALQRGGAVGLNVDENFRKGRLFVPFRGTLASTNASAASLQRRTGAPILVLTANRTAPERYRHSKQIKRGPHGAHDDIIETG